MVGGYEHDLLVTGDPPRAPDDEADRVRCLVVRGSLLRAGKAVEVRRKAVEKGGIVHPIPQLAGKIPHYIGFCSTVSVARFFWLDFFWFCFCLKGVELGVCIWANYSNLSQGQPKLVAFVGGDRVEHARNIQV